MLHRLILVGLLCLTAVCTACRGDLTTTVPVANYLALNLNAAQITLDPGGSFEAHVYAVQFHEPLIEVTEFVDWHTTNASVAEVSASGTVTAIGPGFAVITASITGQNGEGTLTSQSLTVLVTGTPGTPPPSTQLTSIEIRAEDGSAISQSLSVKKTDKLQLSVIAHYSDGSTQPASGVSWRISDQTVAQIDSTGLILPLKPGIVSVNARLGPLESNYVLVQITP